MGCRETALRFQAAHAARTRANAELVASALDLGSKLVHRATGRTVNFGYHITDTPAPTARVTDPPTLTCEEIVAEKTINASDSGKCFEVLTDLAGGDVKAPPRVCCSRPRCPGEGVRPERGTAAGAGSPGIGKKQRTSQVEEADDVVLKIKNGGMDDIRAATRARTTSSNYRCGPQVEKATGTKIKILEEGEVDKLYVRASVSPSRAPSECQTRKLRRASRKEAASSTRVEEEDTRVEERGCLSTRVEEEGARRGKTS